VREFVAAPAALLAGPQIDRFVATLPTDETIAWRQLAALWRIDATGDPSAPCPALQARGVYCHRSTASALSRIRMLDRPGIVRLQRDKLPAVHALLTAISDDTVTLRAGDRVRQMPQASFAKLWQGEFATLWRVPAGWAGAQDGPLSPATRSWIAQGLARVEGQGVVTQPASDEALKARVQAFQKANGLPGGGLPGPMTLMLINRAIGVDEPRLTSGAVPVQMARGN
jgi:general secretion pathway protein A